MGRRARRAARLASPRSAAWVAEDLSALTESGYRMLDLLTDLLDRQKAEAGRLSLDPEPTDIGQYPCESMRVFELWAASAGRRIDLLLADGLPVAWLDRRRVSQILNNLVHNALKHTPEGGSVRVGARIIDGGRLEISVADSGKGFDPNDSERVLQWFDRGTSSEAPIGNGHGLGLAIVDKLVKLHGGTLSIETRPGRGARFAFALPIASGALARAA